jgi:hypothetical protein
MQGLPTLPSREIILRCAPRQNQRLRLRFSPHQEISDSKFALDRTAGGAQLEQMYQPGTS